MDRLKPRKDYSNAISSIVTGVGTAAFSAAMFIQPVMASELGDKMSKFFGTVYGDMKSVFDVAAILALALCLFILLFGRSEKTASSSYSWLFKIVAAFVVFHALGWLVPWIAKQTGGTNTNFKAMLIPLLN